MSFDQYVHRVMSGQARGLGASALRTAMAAVEPIYAVGASWRNRPFDRDPGRARRLARPVVSIGNITAGGTGKTPVVRWLAGRLRDDGRRVAILSRGYGARAGSLGDEQRMLDRLLNVPGRLPVVIRANPDRLAAAAAALADDPAVEAFVLDDGFQHRRAARDLDVVLINATEPFGFGHVLPRGLLREPLRGLARAGAFVMTHALSVDHAERARITRELRRWNPDAPIYRAVHEPVGLRSPAVASADPPDVALTRLRSVRAFAFSGLGNPAGFEGIVRKLCDGYSGAERFADHHDYAGEDVVRLRAAARASGAEVLVTTEKDWVKLAALPGIAEGEMPIWRLDVVARFLDDDGERFLELVREAIGSASVQDR